VRPSDTIGSRACSSTRTRRRSAAPAPSSGGARGDRPNRSTRGVNQPPVFEWLTGSGASTATSPDHARVRSDPAGLPRRARPGHVPPGGVTPSAGGSAVCIMPS
jgi:hypothetical protein